MVGKLQQRSILTALRKHCLGPLAVASAIASAAESVADFFAKSAVAVAAAAAESAESAESAAAAAAAAESKC